MILLAFAAAALAQWTGPRTVEFTGPGYYCGGGYSIALAARERALVLPQAQGAQATRLVLSGGEVNVWNGARKEPGPVVLRYGATTVTQTTDGNGIGYVISDQTPYGLRLTSGAFRGYKLDRWFFKKANFADGADERVSCLAGVSY